MHAIARVLLMALTLASALAAALAQHDSTPAALRSAFAHPPDDTRIMMRWWWFGAAVSEPELKRELQQMRAEGIGGVEIATIYPLALDDASAGFHNRPFVSREYLDALRFAAAEGRQLGMRVDVTLTSGWPFGGPHIPVTEAAGELRVQAVPVPAQADSVAVPAISSGEKLIAAFLCRCDASATSLQGAERISTIADGRLSAPGPGSGTRSVFFFISSRTGMMVKRPAVGAEGFVLDHYDQHAIENHLHAVGDKLLSAFEQPPYAVFSDSLEDYGSNWTPDFLEQFQRRRGYDLTPLLPALVADTGPNTAAVRHDWGRTLTELANERYLQPIHAWAREHHTLFRSQTYGFPPVTLSSNAYEDLPEGEGKATLQMWREFSDTRWAASAGHLFGKPVISSEVWTWLHSPAFRATPLEMKAEADLHFLQGINQLIGHGWPYSPLSAGDPGWRMYAAGAFNEHNPWSFAMSGLAVYLQRVSFVLRQGKPANDIAFLLPNDDAWATFKANTAEPAAVTSTAGFNETGLNVSIDESMPALLGKTAIANILDAGYNLDFIDADAIDTLGINHPVLVLPGVDRLPLATYKKIEEYAERGGIVVATRRLPATAPGMLNAESEGAAIQAISQRLFRGEHAAGLFVADESHLGEAIAARLKPDLLLSERNTGIGFIHRKLTSGDLYFVANTTNQPVNTRATFRNAARRGEWWNALTSEATTIADTAHIELDLQPYESRVLFFSDSLRAKPKAHHRAPKPGQTHTIDLSRDWEVSFAVPGHSTQPTHMDELHSWSNDAATKFYSGVATYKKAVDISADDLRDDAPVVLDFGPGEPVPIPSPLPAQNMRAYLEGPVREAAEVFVNGHRAGVVWCPPYTIDITALVKPGVNRLTISIGNTAINEMSGRALPDYRLLNDRYGVRFVPQGMEHLQPLPSGILGHPSLVFGTDLQPR